MGWIPEQYLIYAGEIEEMDELIIEVELEDSSDGFECVECGKVCKSVVGLEKHIKAKH